MKNIISKVSEMPNIPQPFKMIDWNEITKGYDRLTFDLDIKGDFLPLIWIDKTHKNVNKDTFGLPSYVMTQSNKKDGMQESINIASAILSATLVGINKSNQDGYNWVSMLENFYNTDNKQYLFLDRTLTQTGNTFWYEIYPTVLLCSILYYYPDNIKLNTIMKKTADRWLEACKDLGGENISFDCTSFDHITRKPVSNGKWKEPDASAGIAFILYMAYEKYKDKKYLEGAKWCIEYLNNQNINPNYELLLPYGAYIAARYNAEHDKKLDIKKIVNWIFDGDSDVRPGWGVIAEKWGDYDCHGLCGSLTDWGQRWDCMSTNADSTYKDDLSGYAFAGNTFSTAAGLIPLVRYDVRFARDIGKWMLNAANNSRLFYGKYNTKKRQSCAFVDKRLTEVIAYEGLRKKWDGQSPYATGDAIRYSWGAIDLGLYGSSHVGFFGGIISKTNQEAILQLDCLKTDYYREKAYPTYLYYNPYDESMTVEVYVGENLTNLYDAVNHTMIKQNVVGKTFIDINPDNSIVLVYVPNDATVAKIGKKVLANNIVIDYNINL